MDRDSEFALVAGLRQGDSAAFDAVYAAFNTRLFNFLVRLSQRGDLAEDLLEETWLRLVAHGATLRPDTQLGAWLFAVARNLYASYCRARVVENSHAASLMSLWPVPPPHPSPYEAFAADETSRRIEAALAALPIVHREALLLVGMEGLTPAQAAVVCGISADAMRQRVSRARAALAKRLEPVRCLAVALQEAQV